MKNENLFYQLCYMIVIQFFQRR